MPEVVPVTGPLRLTAPLEAWAGSIGKAGMTPGFITQTKRVRVTTAEANAGITLLAALPNRAYRLIDFTMIAVGGSAATATSVRIAGTQAASTVQLVTVAVAALTQSTAVNPNSANVTLLANGAAFTACDANTAISLNVNNNNLATATAIDVILTYAIEVS